MLASEYLVTRQVCLLHSRYVQNKEKDIHEIELHSRVMSDVGGKYRVISAEIYSKNNCEPGGRRWKDCLGCLETQIQVWKSLKNSLREGRRGRKGRRESRKEGGRKGERKGERTCKELVKNVRELEAIV